MDFNKYFDILNEHNKIERQEKEEKVEKQCCYNPIIIYNDTYIVCENCAVVQKNDLEYDEPIKYLNNKFHLTTLISKSNKKYYHLNRLQKYNNYNYKEVTMINSFQEIKDICNQFNLSKQIYDVAITKYKDIYIDKQISSRDNIKKSIYLYCIIFACDYHNQNKNLEKMLNYINVKKKHYHKAVKKVNKNDIIFINDLLNKKLLECEKNNITISKDDIIILYNNYSKYNLKLNKNSLILFLFYIKLNKNHEDFINIFKTTKITLNKFDKILKNIQQNQ